MSPTRPRRPCLGPPGPTPCPTRALAPPGRSRCPGCSRLVEQGRTARRPERRTYAEITRRRQAVAAHRATYGDWCPGLPGRRPPHPAHDLTADHLAPVGRGGPEDGPLTVRCRSCNSARGAQ